MSTRTNPFDLPNLFEEDLALLRLAGRKGPSRRAACFDEHVRDGWQRCFQDCSPAYLPSQWVFSYRLLVGYVDQHGSLPLKQTKVNGSPVGRWIERQRLARETMPVEQRLLLEAIPAWAWEAKRGRRPQQGRWFTKYEAYRAFLAANDGQHPTWATDRSLYDWGREQKERLGSKRLRPGLDETDPLAAERIRFLEDIPGWDWAIHRRPEAPPKPVGHHTRPLTGFTPFPQPQPRTALSAEAFLDHWDEPLCDHLSGLDPAEWRLLDGEEVTTIGQVVDRLTRPLDAENAAGAWQWMSTETVARLEAGLRTHLDRCERQVLTAAALRAWLDRAEADGQEVRVYALPDASAPEGARVLTVRLQAAPASSN